MDPEEKLKVKKSMWRYRGTLFALAAFAVAAGIVNYFAHLQSTPITDRVRYVAFTREQFKKIADFEKEMVSLDTLDQLILKSNACIAIFCSRCQLNHSNISKFIYICWSWNVTTIELSSLGLLFILPKTILL